MTVNINLPLQNHRQQTEAGWLAELQLIFEFRDSQQPARTALTKKHFYGPLLVQKPFYPENDVCHVYIIHPPGGVVGGDKLNIQVQLEANSHSLITTPAANKFYRSEQKFAQLNQILRVEKNACLEWLPQETIVFDGSYVEMETQIDLAVGAKLICWEITCLARPAANEKFRHGQLKQGLQIRCQGVPLLTDRLLVEGGDESLNAQWGLRGFTVMGYMVIHPADTDMRDAIRLMCHIGAHENLSVSLLNNILVCRYLGYHGEQARQRLSQIWDIVRPGVNNKKAIVPRIWLT